MSVDDDFSRADSEGGEVSVPPRTWEEISAFRHELARSVSFPDHIHDEHQLMWATRGNAMISTALGAWMISPGTAIWMPADIPHTMSMNAPAEFHSLYLAPGIGLTEQRWALSHALTVDEILGAMIVRLESRTLANAQRGRSAAVLFDLLNEAPISGATLPVPRDARAAIIAATLLSDSADRRELREWAEELGVSAKTLARAFQSETLLTFTAWRTRARISASLALLAAGVPVEQIAHDVGYSTASAFIVAFRNQIGISPGAYARRATATASGSARPT